MRYRKETPDDEDDDLVEDDPDWLYELMKEAEIAEDN